MASTARSSLRCSARSSQTFLRQYHYYDIAAAAPADDDDDCDVFSCNTGVTTVQMSNVSEEKRLEVSLLCTTQSENNLSRTDASDSCRPPSSVFSSIIFFLDRLISHFFFRGTFLLSCSFSTNAVCLLLQSFPVGQHERCTRPRYVCVCVCVDI